MKLISHGEQLEQLRRAYNGGKLANGYLLTGIDGIGKKLALIQFIKEIFCSSEKKPCGSCSQCHKVENNIHPDLFIISAEKKDITIEQIRELQAKIQMHVMEAPAKIVIVDDAEKMNDFAANSLLKTLEEPPQKTHLFLITSRPNRLLPTIVSRCQSISFSPLSTKDVENFLVSEKEIERNSAKVLSLVSGGSLGTALLFPEEMVSTVTDGLKKIWNSRFSSEILSVAEEWSDSDINATLSFLNAVYHDIALCNSTGREPIFDFLSREIKGQSEKMTSDAILDKISAINSAQVDAEATYNKQLMFEQLLFRLAL